MESKKLGFEAKGKTAEEKQLKTQQAKALNYQGYVYGLEKLDQAKKKVEDIQANASKNAGKDIFEAKIDLALAETHLDVFKKMYTEDFGGELNI